MPRRIQEQDDIAFSKLKPGANRGSIPRVPDLFDLVPGAGDQRPKRGLLEAGLDRIRIRPGRRRRRPGRIQGPGRGPALVGENDQAAFNAQFPGKFRTVMDQVPDDTLNPRVMRGLAGMGAFKKESGRHGIDRTRGAILTARRAGEDLAGAAPPFGARRSRRHFAPGKECFSHQRQSPTPPLHEPAAIHWRSMIAMQYCVP